MNAAFCVTGQDNPQLRYDVRTINLFSSGKGDWPAAVLIQVGSLDKPPSLCVETDFCPISYGQLFPNWRMAHDSEWHADGPALPANYQGSYGFRPTNLPGSFQVRNQTGADLTLANQSGTKPSFQNPPQTLGSGSETLMIYQALDVASPVHRISTVSLAE